jgi:hypothetical protein
LIAPKWYKENDIYLLSNHNQINFNQSSKMSTSNSRVILTTNEWDVTANKYMKPYVTKSGSKTISIISTQLNRALYVSTPMMMTWGCSDFTDANGDSDGRYNISMNFPNDEYRNEQTDLLLQKMKDFENQILDDAVKNAETWWGESMSREICKHTFFPILKYSKNKDTHKVDYTKPPSFRAKVPMMDGVWKVEIYNTSGELIFPNNNPEQTPDKLITKLSSVACGIQSTGIWIGGKGWGVTWKLVQCVLKPKEIVNITGRCFITIPPEERTVAQQKPSIVEAVVIPKQNVEVLVEDSDDECDISPNNQIQLVELVEEPEPTPVPVKKVIKKTISEMFVPTIPAPTPAQEPTTPSVVMEEATTPTPEPVKKKIMKKKT